MTLAGNRIALILSITLAGTSAARAANRPAVSSDQANGLHPTIGSSLNDGL